MVISLELFCEYPWIHTLNFYVVVTQRVSIMLAEFFESNMFQASQGLFPVVFGPIHRLKLPAGWGAICR